MKRKLDGFTLIEMLVTIILLGVVATIVIVNMTSVNKRNKESEYERFVASIKSAAQVYVNQNEASFQDLYVNKSYIYITVGDLIEDGLLDEGLINPYTNQIVDKTERIKVVLDSATGAISFVYPDEDTKTEQYMVMIDDYVVYGEPYDCLEGIGTYRLALSDESGNLITDKDKLLNDYKLTCSYPSSWQNFNNSSVTPRTDLKYTQQAGTYQIDYEWISESGTRKHETRNITVLDKFIPSVNLKAVSMAYNTSGTKPTVSADVFNKGTDFNTVASQSDNASTHTTIYDMYRPTYNCTNGQWTFLAFKPQLVGADIENTTYTITKSIAAGSTYLAKDNNVYKSVANADYDGRVRNDFDHIFIADDGDVIYKIQTETGGHYFKNYKYKSNSEIRIKQDISIPSCLLAGGSNSYTTAKTIQIKDIYSPVGIATYEYKLAAPSTPASTLAPVTTSTIRRTGNPTNYTASVIGSYNASGTCNLSETTYNTAFIRPINTEGYYGSWTPVNVYVTNSLSKLVETNRGTACSNSCANVSGLGGSMTGLNCYYCNKNIYTSYNGVLLNVLGKYADNSVLVASDGSMCQVSGTTVTRYGIWGIQTCDGYFTAGYFYMQPYVQALLSALGNVESGKCGTLFKGISTYPRVFAKHNWYIAGTRYYGYSGIPTLDEYNRFQSGLYGGGTYWLGTTVSHYNVYVRVSHGESTYKANTYFRTANGANLSTSYSAGTANLKTMHKVANGIVCSGNGTAATPYVLSRG